VSTGKVSVALVGDSIFDNAAYVPGEPALAAQLFAALPQGCKVALLALDGSSAQDVTEQLRRLPRQTTHIVVSAGGNDALYASGVLAEPADTVGEALTRLAPIQEEFRRAYELMLREILGHCEATTVCTIYDAIPGLGPVARTALAIFNDAILRSAFQSNLPVIDLRLVCDEAEDFSSISAIEPSSRGALKIATQISHVTQSHDFATLQTVIYPRGAGMRSGRGIPT
jgi:hypothetical protein